MQGRGLDEEGESSVHRGLQPRVFDYLYAKINQEKKCNPNMEYFVKCSYLEIYNEQIMDLVRK
jgi:kinesin family member 15